MINKSGCRNYISERFYVCTPPCLNDLRVRVSSLQIRFSQRKLFVDVKGVFVSQTRLTCVTPNFTETAIPPGRVDVRVCLAGESFTTTKADFTFFPVTDAKYSFMYGPSLLEEGVAGRETTFVIKVRCPISWSTLLTFSQNRLRCGRYSLYMPICYARPAARKLHFHRHGY